LDVQEDLSLFVLIALHASRSGRIPDIVNLALEHGLAGYDPQTGSAVVDSPSTTTR
jgi:hypothetical protein